MGWSDLEWIGVGWSSLKWPGVVWIELELSVVTWRRLKWLGVSCDMEWPEMVRSGLE